MTVEKRYYLHAYPTEDKKHEHHVQVYIHNRQVDRWIDKNLNAKRLSPISRSSTESEDLFEDKDYALIKTQIEYKKIDR